MVGGGSRGGGRLWGMVIRRGVKRGIWGWEGGERWWRSMGWWGCGGRWKR